MCPCSGLISPRTNFCSWKPVPASTFQVLEFFQQLIEIRRIGPNGVTLAVRVFWMTEHLLSITKFITLLPDKLKNAMKFELYKDVVLTCDLPEERLKRGDIVKLVEHHASCDREDG